MRLCHRYRNGSIASKRVKQLYCAIDRNAFAVNSCADTERRVGLEARLCRHHSQQQMSFRTRASVQSLRYEKPASIGETGERCTPKKLAVFVSGGGSNFREIHRAILEGKINGTIEMVVSDKKKCGALDYAREHGIDCIQYPQSELEDNGLQQLLQTLGDLKQIDYVLLAGYLKLIPLELCIQYPRGILNIHPALLPSFGGKGYYGMNVHKAVHKSGVRYTGATVHFLSEKYDEGPILAQACVPVYPDDTPEDIAARVLKREHELFPSVVAALCNNRITWREDGVPILWSAT